MMMTCPVIDQDIAALAIVVLGRITASGGAIVVIRTTVIIIATTSSSIVFVFATQSQGPRKLFGHFSHNLARSDKATKAFLVRKRVSRA